MKREIKFRVWDSISKEMHSWNIVKNHAFTGFQELEHYIIMQHIGIKDKNDGIFRPILFSTPMVKAILDGRKTQTRRIVKDKNLQENKNEYKEEEFLLATIKSKINKDDILWARETFAFAPLDLESKKHYPELSDYIYKATFNSTTIKWKPSIFMPKSACRIFLKVTNVRVERLQNISEQDAIAEGITEYAYGYWRNYESSFSGGRPKTGVDYRKPIESFRSLWQSINGKESWKGNPWVWVYDFELIERPLGFR